MAFLQNIHLKLPPTHQIKRFIQFIYSVRGTLSTILVVASSGGAFLGFLAGHLLPYELGPWISLAFPIAFLCTYSFMPETPYFLMKSNRMEVCLLSSFLTFHCNFRSIFSYFI